MASHVQERFRDAIGNTGRFFRSRHKTLEMLRTLALVIPLTCLIWIYAERTQVATEKAQIILEVESPDPNLKADILNPTTIVVDLSGPRARVEALKDRLESSTAERKYSVILPGTYKTAGEPSVPVTTLLNADKEIQASNVTVTNATPPTVTVRIEKIIPLRDAVTVQIPPDVGASLQNVVIDPPTVKVRGPQSEIERHFSGASPTLMVDWKSVADGALAPGPTHSLVLPLKLPSADITVEPKTVTVRYDVAARETEYTISSLPIFVQLLLPMQGNVKVDVNRQTITNIKVRGPADAVAKLRPGPQGQPPAQQLTAVLEIKAEDVGKTELRGNVQITDLPPGVTVVGTPPELEYSVREKDGSEG